MLSNLDALHIQCHTSLPDVYEMICFISQWYSL